MITTNMKKTIVGIGELLWDVLPEGMELGGAPANFVHHASQFGFNSYAVSAVGKDSLGKLLVEKLEEKGLNEYLETVPFDTGTVQIELDEKGIPYYHIRENVAWDNIRFTPKLKELAQKTSIVCFGSLAQRNIISRETINQFLDAMPDHESVYKIFDINLRQSFYTKEIICQSLEKCNVLKINDEELIVICKLFGYSDIDIENECWNILKKYNLKILILTCGSEGSYVFTPDHNFSYMKTPKVDVADTVGAGDSFTAAFISALLQGKSVEEAHRLAVKVSAYVCTQKGAMIQLPKEIIE